jgi:hypothetical protein
MLNIHEFTLVGDKKHLEGSQSLFEESKKLSIDRKMLGAGMNGRLIN